MLPTPTPMPAPGPALIDLSNITPTYRIWAFADDAIAWWNRLGEYAFYIQIAVLLLVVAVAAFLIYRLVSNLSNKFESGGGSDDS